MKTVLSGIVIAAAWVGLGFAPAKTGKIEGYVHFPACFVPDDLSVCAIPEGGGAPICTAELRPTEKGHAYRLEVPAGRWLVYSIAPKDLPGRRAFYTRAVTCGLSYACEDHARIVVNVLPGARLQNINPDDWIDPPTTLPPQPSREERNREPARADLTG